MKIAVIFSEYPIPAQHSWFNMAKNIAIPKIKIFQHAYTNQKDINNLRLHNKYEKLKSIISQLIFFQRIRYKTLTYAPLISFDPKTVHLIDAHLYPSIVKILPLSTKLIVTFRGFDTLVEPNINTNWYHNLVNIYKRADVLHFVSKHLMESAIKLGAPEEKCIVIYQSVDINTFSFQSIVRHNIDDGILKIVSTGRLVWEKGYIYAIEAISILHKQGFPIKYNIYGSGPDLASLTYHIKRLSLEDVCTIHGNVPKSSLVNALHQSDVYLHPSLSEGIPNSILEASYLGLPVVSTTVGGIPEAVIHKKTGLLCPPASSSEIANSLLQLFSAPNLRKELGMNGHSHMMNSFYPEQEIEKWKQIYISL